MVFEGDFVPGVVPKTKLEPATDYNVFAFPSVDGSEPVVVGGGDTVVMFKDTPGREAFVKYLARPRRPRSGPSAAASLAEQERRRASTRTTITRTTATALADAETFRFDMSDLQPAAFGGTAGQGDVEDPPGLPEEPDRRRRHRAGSSRRPAAKAYK